jgi:3-dehydroquinate dehydratase/shikimate dehydrogenase
MTYLAVPIAAKNLNEAEQQIKAAQAAGAELLELRTDYLVHLSIDLAWKVITAARQLAPAVPIIVTCRDYHQGGALRHSNQLRTSVLTASIRAGVEFVDIEFDNFRSEAIHHKLWLAVAAGSKTRLILSAHQFQKRFDDIAKLHQEILANLPTAIPKLVYTAGHINDCFDALDLLHNAKQDVIAFCMGEPGLITRILAKKLNGLVAFASIDEKTATAPGQPTAAQLKNIFRWDSINADTDFYGVIGSPVTHSLSPAVHNACFAEAGLNKVFLPLLVAGGQDGFDAFLNNILARPWLSFHGFSVTIPHKENALNYVKSKNGFIDPLASKIGAVNTLVVADSGASPTNHQSSIINHQSICAYNTDCPAALDTITSFLGIDKAGLKGMPVAIIGAGGVSRAIVAGLADAKAKIIIYNRTVERAKKLAHEFKCDYAGLDDLRKLKATLVINCTSIGMSPHTDSAPVDSKFLNKDMAVFDTVYNPAETLLLKQAKQLGCKTISGLDMFISQAAEQFKLFTGHGANIEIMRKTLSSKL